MLQAQRAVCVYSHRLALDLEVTVRYCYRSLFVETRQQLRVAVHSVIDSGFMQTAVAGARIGGDIFEAEGLNHIQHEVGSGTYRRQRAIVDSSVHLRRRRLWCA